MTTWVLATLIWLAISYAVNIPLSLLGNLVAYGSILGQEFGSKSQEFSASGLLISLGFSALGSFLTYPLQAGLFYMGLKQVRGERIQPGDIFGGYRFTVNVFVAYLLMGLLIVISFVLFIIPSFFVAGALAFAPLLVMDKRMNGIEAIQESYNALKSHAWSMFAFVFVVGLVASLGVCACGIGILVTYPVFMVGIALTYHNFFPPVQADGYYQPIGIAPPM